MPSRRTLLTTVAATLPALAHARKPAVPTPATAPNMVSLRVLAS